MTAVFIPHTTQGALDNAGRLPGGLPACRGLAQKPVNFSFGRCFDGADQQSAFAQIKHIQRSAAFSGKTVWRFSVNVIVVVFMVIIYYHFRTFVKAVKSG
jgi:hypothetical protein